MLILVVNKLAIYSIYKKKSNNATYLLSIKNVLC